MSRRGRRSQDISDGPQGKSPSGGSVVGGLDPQREISSFATINRCLLDSSSAIYMAKAGFLDLLCTTLDIATIREVVGETGFAKMHVTVIDSPGPKESQPGAQSANDGLGMARARMSADQLLIAAAFSLKIPVITEDRKMMLRLDSGGVSFFNALMMLHLLLYRGKLDPAEHAVHLSRLLGVCRYSSRVLAYGEEVLQAVYKYR